MNEYEVNVVEPIYILILSVTLQNGSHKLVIIKS